MTGSNVLAQVPLALRSEYEAGTVYRVGMLLFRKGEPGIVAHLVEGGGLQKAVGIVAQANPVGASLSLASQIYGNIQNERILEQLATLRDLQLGNLALSGMGIGATMISHSLLMRRLNRIEQTVNLMDEKLDQLSRSIEALRSDFVRRDFVDLKTACEAADDAWEAGNKELAWDKAASELHKLKNRFRDRVVDLLERGAPQLVDPFLDAYALASTTRISCRVAAGDIDLSIRNARDFAEEIASLLFNEGTPSFLNAGMAEIGIRPGNPEYVVSMERLRPEAEAWSSMLREREQIAASLPHTLSRVKQLELNGREWLEEARNNAEEAVLLLPGKRQRE